MTSIAGMMHGLFFIIFLVSVYIFILLLFFFERPNTVICKIMKLLSLAFIKMQKMYILEEFK